jgi:hypothetical protein
MSLSSKEAAETLSSVEQASRRSAQAFGYSKASPHLILWGTIWVIGYSAIDLRPADAGLIWGALILAGCAAGYFISRSSCTTSRGGWRVFGVACIALLFISATYTIMWPVHGPQLATFPALLTGTVYAGVGLWLGTRYLVTGLAIIALTMGSYLCLHEHLMLWMSFVGGGGMALAGIWFRTV